MRVVSAVVDVVQRAGVPREALLHAAQLAPGDLERPEARVSESEISRLCEHALALSGDPALGLHWGERLTVDTFVPVSYLVTHATTLRQALASLTQFATLLSDLPGYEIVDDAAQMSMRCQPRRLTSPALQRFVAELTVCGFVHIVRCFHAHWQPQHVCFAYPAPEYRDEYARVFGPGVRFDCSYSGLGFAHALLDTVSLHKDEGIHQALQELATQRLSRIARRAPYAVRVRDHLLQQGRLTQRDMPQVAQALGLSVRSLRRRLAAEGTSYADVENEAFTVLAKRLLLDRSLTIQQTAFELGFSGSTTFHRAFKRATGMTPNTFLAAQLGRTRA
jgi:AraC-like DNA-binding protein